MPLVVNGVTIPENVANALGVNGVNITQVIANGVAVWTQSLFSGVWSGDSLVYDNSVSGYHGLSTSGSNYRSAVGAYGSTFYGAWIVANSSGLATGESIGFTSPKNGISTTPTTYSIWLGGSYYTGVSFNTVSKFTGTIGATSGVRTSGGAIATLYSGVQGAWVYLN